MEIDAQDREATEVEVKTASPEAKQSAAKNNFTLRVVAAAVICSFVMGYCVSGTNTFISTIIIDLGWCYEVGTFVCQTGKTNETIVTSILFVTSILGSAVSGYLTTFGRRFALIVLMVTYCIGLSLSAASTGVIMLALGRGISGFAVGANGLVITRYISEISPKASRGFYVAMQQLAVFVGMLSPILLGFALTPADQYTTDSIPHSDKIWWRLMFGLGLVPSTYLLIVLLFINKFETPHYLVSKGDVKTAREILSCIYDKTNVEGELNEIMKATEGMNLKENGTPSFFKLMKESRQHRFTIYVGAILFFGVQLGGISAFMSGSNGIMIATGISTGVATAISTGMMVVGILGNTFSLYVIDLWGRRPLLVYGITCGTAFSIIAAVAFNLFPDSPALRWIAPISIVGYVGVYSVTLGPVPFTYAGEIFPSEIRSAGMTICFISNWLFGAVCVILEGALTTAQTFLIFAGCGALCSIFSFIFLLETAGKSIDDSPYISRKIKVETVEVEDEKIL